MLRLASLLAAALLMSSAGAVHAQNSSAVFTDTRLRGNHLANESYGIDVPEVAGNYLNPILPGFYPDPSITRVGDSYYLVNSSFAFWPGIPVWTSKDLVNWTQIANAIDRPGQLDFSKLGTSRGVFAPSISHHDGVFYIINTCVDCKGNFVITATDPAGPWSDPVWLPFGGIDPSLFWDKDGKAYVVWNDAPAGEPLYSGHRAIWMQEFDPKTKTMTGDRKLVVDGGVDISTKPIWIEGPHIYRVNGTYYLMAAEGGTSEGHSEVIFKANSVWGPYTPGPGNPILTQRDLDPSRADPITSTGHADLVQTQKGEWWAVFLGTRPYSDDQYNTGRETFLLPVTWKDGWPVILEAGKPVPYSLARPKGLGKQPQPSPFYQYITGYDPLKWLSIRGPSTGFLTVSDNGKTLSLAPAATAIGDLSGQPAFVGLRQQGNTTAMDTKLDFMPSEGDRAGLLAVQSDTAWAFCGLTRRDGITQVALVTRAGASEPAEGVVQAAQPVDASGGVHLTLEARRDKLYCSYVTEANYMKTDFTHLTPGGDATILSTKKAGGFVGTIIGPYAYAASH